MLSSTSPQEQALRFPSRFTSRTSSRPRDSPHAGATAPRRGRDRAAAVRVVAYALRDHFPCSGRSRPRHHVGPPARSSTSAMPASAPFRRTPCRTTSRTRITCVDLERHRRGARRYIPTRVPVAMWTEMGDAKSVLACQWLQRRGDVGDDPAPRGLIDGSDRRGPQRRWHPSDAFDYVCLDRARLPVSCQRAATRVSRQNPASTNNAAW